MSPVLPVRRALRAAALLAAAVAGAADHDYFLTGSAADVRPERTAGGLLLMGGGGDVDEAFRWFIRQAGGGDLVVLRASGGDGYHDYAYRKIGGIDSIETIVFHARSAASDPRVLAVLAQADGIFLAGGDQGEYVRQWKDTPVAAALEAHVRAGRPLGGTSAGLAVLGQFAFAALGTGSLTSDIALADPFDPRITLERDFLRLELLRGVITDTHFMPRRRLGRALVFLARLQADANPPALLGLGVDEKTALCVEADGSARVYSPGDGHAVWLLVPTRPAEQLAPGRPLTFRDVQVVGLGPDSTFHLPTRQATRPVALSTVSVVAGRLSQTP